MKRIQLLLFILMTSSVFGEYDGIDNEYIELRGDYVVSDNYKTVDKGNYLNEKKGGEKGYSGSLELIHHPYSHLISGLGIGVERYKRVEVKGGESIDKFQVVPIYFTLKYVFNPYGEIHPYTKIDLGWTVPVGHPHYKGKRIKGHTNYYVALGIGVEYKGVVVDLVYKKSKTKLTRGINGNLDYGRVALGVGYRFILHESVE